MCIFFISVCCCFYFYRKNDQCHQYEPTPNIKSIYDNENIEHIQHKRKNSFSSSIRINPLAQNSEGCQEESIKKSIMELVETVERNDAELELLKSKNAIDNNVSKMALFTSIHTKLKKVASVSMHKLSKSNDEEKKSINDHIVISPESKSRASVSICHSKLLQESIKPKHTYSLSMEQLEKLKHGLAIQTIDGIRIKVNKHGVYHPIKYINDENEEEELQSSNESMYNYQPTENDTETDDGFTTPTAESNKHLIFVPKLPKEGMIGDNNNYDQ
eukprot:291262_1